MLRTMLYLPGNNPNMDLLREADGIIHRIPTKLPGELLRQLPRLKVIAHYGVGVDLIDVDAATKLGIAVCVTPGANTRSVAEQVVALAYCITKRLPTFTNELKKGNFGIRYAALQPTELKGHTAVVLGFGRIGRVAAALLRGNGMHFVYPDARTIIDIGGQDVKVLSLGKNGALANFVMNDKCAAGTGRFLELMARTLDFRLDEMGQKGLEWTEEVSISSMCTVFAESEVVSLVARNTPPADIIHGLNQAVAAKTHMPGIKAFTAAVFGGIGSIPGALLGGLLLGVIEIFAKAYISTQLSDAIVFAVLIVVLLVKPTGLLGKQIREKV